MDPFSFHPPGLSPSSATTYQQLSPTDSPGRPGSGSDGYQRSGSAGGGASAAGGFTATLPPLHEQPSNESVPGTHGGAARPGSASYGRLEGDFGATGDGDGGDLFASTSSGRRSHPQDLSQPAPSAAERRDEDMTAAVSMAMLGSRDHLNSSGGHCASETAHEIASDSVFGFNPPPLDPPNPGLSMANHAFFHPQMVHPSVNTRNTRPMTAPSRSGYLTGLQYSSVPSAFYVPPQLQHIPSLNGSISPTNYEAPPGSGNHELFAYQPEVSTPQFELPTPRSRGFSVPDALATSALGDRPATAEGSDALSAGGPFFFQPPLPPEGRPVVLPGYVPAGMEPFAMGAMPPPAFPPAQHLPDPADGFAPSLDGQHERRRSSAPAGKYNFVAQPPQHRKRPRRRYDEIERMYNCDYPGCTKAYGTLNHLNSHKTMQKHGPKATPAQFKEMRKAWRERKKAEAAEAARAKAKEPAIASSSSSAHSILPAPVAPYPINSTDRPRPSTSAGEYTFGVPGQTLAPVSFPPPPVLHSMSGLPPALIEQPTPSVFLNSPFGAGDAFDDNALRPVTAPSYHHAPPPFGGGVYALDLLQQQQQHHQRQQRSDSSSQTSGAVPPPNGAEFGFEPRRYSLPGFMLGGMHANGGAGGGYPIHPNSMPPPSSSIPRASLSQSMPPSRAVPQRMSGTPEMKMPQPMHAPPNYANLMGPNATSRATGSPRNGAANGREDQRSPSVNDVTVR